MLVSQSLNEPIHPMNIHCASNCARDGAGDKVVCREDTVMSLYEVTYVQIEEFWMLEQAETLPLYSETPVLREESGIFPTSVPCSQRKIKEFSQVS